MRLRAAQRLRAGVKGIAGLALGAATALVEAVFLVVAAVGVAYAFVFSRGQDMVPRTVARAARWLVEVERRRLKVLLGGESVGGYGPLQALAYLVLRVPVGLLSGAVLLLLVYGLGVTAVLLSWWILGTHPPDYGPTPMRVLGVGLVGAVLLYLDLQGLAGAAVLERRLARRCLGPSLLELYERRIAQLSASRAEVVDAVDDERRRIERDLHDGVQQRLVGLSMLIGRARRARDPERAAELVRQAHEEAQRALEDLREVSWRVYPAALDADGLRAALETVAERSAVPVVIDYAAAGRLPSRVETAAYFVVCEAVTNAAKHARARRVTVRVREHGTMLSVRIEDDGVGGADPAGGGLAGLARRAAALDGRLTVDSPPGGPTVITAELPCG
ncbi:sensor histidine kinase [Thermomonospora cellulosilytica]|uniref:histidine kinase n=1 Tax=Thermomonospora cellulosilytica TaxID=1411118 RepID=A0A7W3MZS2_9ACTN|nr:histidine kinase [Thermomonospora cellulosilytica]MBA9004869.1 signal transduction histidine kinase [Thermomonospora cellulosilytica]